MKPIVIEVKDGKINMSISEFKKYIEDAYQQGYSDASKVSSYNDPYWWRNLTCTNGTPTDALKITYCNDDSDSITGILDAHTSAR